MLMSNEPSSTMETLVVLTALVCGAIAAPALHEQAFQELKPTQDVIEELVQREKKSPASNHGFSEFSNAETSPTQTFDSFPETARSLHFKKPLIVKKKVGYHLYRDSDEEKEQANSRESCKERVKVKLCDEKILPKSSDPIGATAIEDVGDHVMSEDEMKHSLKIAKEAIANLERDLRKIEQKPGTKIEHDDVDAHIHEDIDTARQVLEHIHKNFGDMESMSIRTTTTKDAGSLHNVHLMVAKTEEEKMAQWKEAIKNIEKNTEIARNIENSFKSLNDFQMAQTTNTDVSIDTDKISHEMRTENTELIHQNPEKLKRCKSKLHNTKSATNQAEEKEHSVDDMNSFASSIVESTLNTNSGKLVRNNNQEINFDESPTTNEMISLSNKNDNNFQQSKSSDISIDGKKSLDTSNSEQNQFNSMGNVESDPVKDFSNDDTEAMVTKEDVLNTDPISSPGHMKSTDPDESRDSEDCTDKGVDTSLNEDKNNNNKPVDMNTETKSATNDDSSDENLDLQTEKRKTFDSKDTTTSNQLLHQTRNDESDAMTSETQQIQHTIAKPSDNTEKPQIQGKMRQNEKNMSQPQITQGEDLKAMHIKSSDNENILKRPPSNAFHVRWSSDQNEHEGIKEMDNFPSNFHNRAPLMNTDFMNGPHMAPTRHFDATSSHAHMHTSHVDRVHSHITNGKSPEMDNMAQPNFNMNMRDAVGNFGPNNNMMRWKPTHESARTAYGPMAAVASSGASPSAVGLFPNANVGGCSIPLLLSCSPSVTSGSLAKALPAGYASPAYRSEDEFTFIPNKREVKKTNEIVDTTETKIPTNAKQKIKST